MFVQLSVLLDVPMYLNVSLTEHGRIFLDVSNTNQANKNKFPDIVLEFPVIARLISREAYVSSIVCTGLIFGHFVRQMELGILIQFAKEI